MGQDRPLSHRSRWDRRGRVCRRLWDCYPDPTRSRFGSLVAVASTHIGGATGEPIRAARCRARGIPSQYYDVRSERPRSGALPPCHPIPSWLGCRSCPPTGERIGRNRGSLSARCRPDRWGCSPVWRCPMAGIPFGRAVAPYAVPCCIPSGSGECGRFGCEGPRLGRSGIGPDRPMYGEWLSIVLTNGIRGIPYQNPPVPWYWSVPGLTDYRPLCQYSHGYRGIIHVAGIWPYRKGHPATPGRTGRTGRTASTGRTGGVGGVLQGMTVHSSMTVHTWVYVHTMVNGHTCVNVHTMVNGQPMVNNARSRAVA